jgi:hypothetical protein
MALRKPHESDNQIATPTARLSHLGNFREFALTIEKLLI